MEKEVRVERLLQKMLTGLNTLFALIVMAVVFLVPWLYKESLWKIYMKGIQVLYSYWTGGIRLDAPWRVHILGCTSLLLLHCYGMTQAVSRCIVGWNLVAVLGFFSCRTLMRLRWVSLTDHVDSPWRVRLNSLILNQFESYFCIFRFDEKIAFGRSTRNPMNGIQVYIHLRFIIGLTWPYLSGICIPALGTAGLSYASLALFFACGSRGPILDRSLSGVYSLNMVFIISLLFYIFGFMSQSSEGLLESYNHHFLQETPHRKWNESPTTMMAYYRRLHMKSLTPIRFQVGNTYYLDKFSFLEFWMNVADKTFLLLSCFPLY